MIVYGDHGRHVDPAVEHRRIAADLAAIAALPPGLERHGRLVGALIATGMLVQGLADRGAGAAAVATLMADATLVARAVIASWDSDFAEMPALPDLTQLDARSEMWPHSVLLKLPEGYAWYALYPESYAIAARRLPVTGAPVVVVGIRSIGTSLAAIVAAALDAPPPMTVRPDGPPFDRQVAPLPPVPDGAQVIVVDEGPGLSGSSFAATAAMLAEIGVPPDRIAFLPSHGGGPGPEATPVIRHRWATTAQAVVEFEVLIPPERLRDWAETLLGPLDGVPHDVSGGAWRQERYADPARWPAVAAQQERRKYLVRRGGRRWLLKFAGLGAEGARKLDRARRLAAAGLVPPVHGLLHGFLIMDWLDGAADDAGPGPMRVADYLAARQRLLPPPEARGAALADLAEMARHNLGRDIPALAGADRLAGRVVSVAIDGRMDGCEWIGGVKADALDHDRSHDLIGAQDIAWDVAGAIVELDYGPEQIAVLLGRLESVLARAVDPALLRFYHPCYCAFRLGAATFARSAATPADAARLDARITHYRETADAGFA
ncbi:MAG TPA: hypothetical protein VF649_15175 [Sphingomonas sp.]|uniref:hypothetical protein n=1 Tax=Sphingomonas sp. TaxID=28214 RepID=UPI002ED83198